MPLRVIFMGTPEFSVPTLLAIAAHGHEIAAVYTQPPRAGGRRGLSSIASPVHRAAQEQGWTVRTPASLRNAEEQAAFIGLGADIAVVVAYGLILPPAILGGTRLGAYNGHASLLPRWRGAAPIQRAIMAGDTETGMMVMKMEEGLDTGPVALAARLPIGPETTAGDLHDQLAEIGARLMVEALARLEHGHLPLTPQPQQGVTYAGKILKEETRVGWTLPAVEVDRRIRGLSPIPGAWCEFVTDHGKERLKLLRSRLMVSEGGVPGELLDDELSVACGEGAVRLLVVQRAGGRPLGGADFLRGAKLRAGTVFL